MSDHDPRLLEAAKKALKKYGVVYPSNLSPQDIVKKAGDLGEVAKALMNELLCKF